MTHQNPHSTVLLRHILLLTLIAFLQINAETYLGQNPCIKKNKCSDCIQTPSCSWCSQLGPEFENQPRCFQQASTAPHLQCHRDFTYSPSISFNITENRPLTKINPGRTRRQIPDGGGKFDGETNYVSRETVRNRYSSASNTAGGKMTTYERHETFGGGEWPPIVTTKEETYTSNYTSQGGAVPFGGGSTITRQETTYERSGGGGGGSGFSSSSSSSSSSGGFSSSSGGFSTVGGQPSITTSVRQESSYGGNNNEFSFGQSAGGSHDIGINKGIIIGENPNFGGGGGRDGVTIENEEVIGGDNGFSSSRTHWSETTYTEETSEIVQVSPQRVTMKLRARESYSFTVHYTQAKDYPVDLYYLMDLSKSMEDDKDKLSKLGKRLAKTMQAMTKDFQLGFGSFVDKVVMPYVSTVPANLDHPCTNCSAPYGFRHAMTLSEKVETFSQMVRSAQVSGNLDAPEGGFDAIMQAVVCKNQIGWRDHARKLLVFSTDDAFHYAGDGKLGGIITPNDGLCHLKDDYYSYSSVQDYPSISQLSAMIKQNSINVIFAVTEKHFKVYDELRKHIEGASSVTLLQDSSNVVDLVKAQYKEIVSTVEFRDNTTSEIVIRYHTKCSNLTTENVTNKCTGFKVGEVIDFRVEVFLKECPKDPSKWNQTIRVYPVGLSENLYIDLEMLCGCPCERDNGPGYQVNSEYCHKMGTLRCGLCECDSLYTGSTCKCKHEYSEKNTTGCRQPGSHDTVDCSGKGTCECGKCVCETSSVPGHTITGDWCECDSFACHRSGGDICGGHGKCNCGRCDCDLPWTGQACECYNNTNTCYPFKENAKECDGHGKCICGACQCDSTPLGNYTGRYCQRCPNCTETCDELKPCVLCHMWKVGYTPEECVQNCKNFTLEEVDVVQANDFDNEFACAGYDADDCRYVFVYSEINDYFRVKAQKHRECPPKVFLLGVILGVIAAVVIMGMAILLLWKLLTTIHDRREFAKFEKERMMSKWETGENPIYKQATSTFKNPTYAGKG